jgi:hypothetical protein
MLPTKTTNQSSKSIEALIRSFKCTPTAQVATSILISNENKTSDKYGRVKRRANLRFCVIVALTPAAAANAILTHARQITPSKVFTEAHATTKFPVIDDVKTPVILINPAASTNPPKERNKIIR